MTFITWVTVCDGLYVVCRYALVGGQVILVYCILVLSLLVKKSPMVPDVRRFVSRGCDHYMDAYTLVPVCGRVQS